jgi:hypothetical protein
MIIRIPVQDLGKPQVNGTKACKASTATTFFIFTGFQVCPGCFDMSYTKDSKKPQAKKACGFFLADFMAEFIHNYGRR